MVFIDKVVSPTVRRWLCVVGGFITLLSFSVGFSFTNISTYLISYMRNNATNNYNKELTYEDFIFFTTSRYVVQYGGMPFIGVLCRKIGPRISVFIGSAIISIGFMLTYFSIKSYWINCYQLSICHIDGHIVRKNYVIASDYKQPKLLPTPCVKFCGPW